MLRALGSFNTRDQGDTDMHRCESWVVDRPEGEDFFVRLDDEGRSGARSSPSRFYHARQHPRLRTPRAPPDNETAKCNERPYIDQGTLF